MDGEAWWATAYGVTKSWTRLSDFTSLYGPHEERKLPLPSYRTVRRMYPGGTVAKNPAANAGDAGDVGLIPALERSAGRRKWQPPPVFLPGESMDGGAWQTDYSPMGLQRVRHGSTHITLEYV